MDNRTSLLGSAPESIIGGEEELDGMEIHLHLSEDGRVGISTEVHNETRETAQAYVDFVTDKYIATGIAILKYFHITDIKRVKKNIAGWVHDAVELLALPEEELKELLDALGEKNATDRDTDGEMG